MLYNGFRLFFRVYFKIFYRLQAIGIENIPDRGAVILCANHISLYDPPVVGTPLRRKVNYMAKQELFDIPLFGAIIRNLGAYPVKRGGISKDSIRRTLQILKEGSVLGIFPEGSRREQGLGKKGAASFALRSEAVVIPVAIVGPYRLFRRVQVIYGPPIPMEGFRSSEDPDRVDQVTEAIMDSIRELLRNHGSRPAS